MSSIKSIRYSRFFKNKGIDTINFDYYNQINVWKSWYRSYVRSFHQYRVFTGKGGWVTKNRKSLKMAKKVCEDIADMLMNERVTMTVGDDATNNFVQSVLDRSDFATKANEYQERKAAMGTVAYVPCMYNIVTDDEGNVISADVKINYISAQHIFPVSWENGRIINVAFAIEAKYHGHRYAMVQYHELVTNDDGFSQYVITNNFIDDSGHDVSRETWGKIPLFKGMATGFETGSDQPQFAIDRLAIVNNVSEDINNPMGIPIFANSVDTIEKIDLEYDSYYNEFDLGKKRIFVSPEMMTDENGELLFDPHDTVFYQLSEDLKDPTKPIVESNMELRIEEHEKAINNDLNLLSMKCGFGTQYYRFERGGITTATQVISENSDLYRTIKKHEIPLESALRTMIKSIIRLGMAAGVPNLDPDAEIKIDFDDSIIQDKDAERRQDREDVNLGVMTKEEYRAKWYHETPNMAARKVKQAGGQTTKQEVYS